MDRKSNQLIVSFHLFLEYVLEYVFDDYYLTLIVHIFVLNHHFEFESFLKFDHFQFCHFQQLINVELKLKLVEKQFSFK